MNKKRGIYVIVIIILISAIGGVVYYKMQNKENTPSVNPTPAEKPDNNEENNIEEILKQVNMKKK